MNTPVKDTRREILREVIFEADTPAGKLFDVVLIIAILLSVGVVMLDSIKSLQEEWGHTFYALEWVFTILFTIEYILRLYCIGKPSKYAFSFFGIIDLLAILPTYISLFIPGTRYIAIVRILRVLRVFRILKIAQYVSEVEVLMRAVRASGRKITVFLFAMVTMVVILGSLMYIIEGSEDEFTSIPQSIYWAIVTLTTVGYGDMAPKTPVGQAFAAFIMIVGYSIIAVPTGIVTVELSRSVRSELNTIICPDCSAEGHDPDAVYCKHCGFKMK